VKPFDLYEALELSPSCILEEGKVKGGASRLRSQYHKLSMRYHPDSFKPKRSGNATPVATQRASAEQHFRRVAIAFETLKVLQLFVLFLTNHLSPCYHSPYHSTQYCPTTLSLSLSRILLELPSMLCTVSRVLRNLKVMPK
jgi:hypothetical protein